MSGQQRHPRVAPFSWLAPVACATRRRRSSAHLPRHLRSLSSDLDHSPVFVPRKIACSNARVGRLLALDGRPDELPQVIVGRPRAHRVPEADLVAPKEAHLRNESAREKQNFLLTFLESSWIVGEGKKHQSADYPGGVP